MNKMFLINNRLKKVIYLQESPVFEFVPVSCNQRSVSSGSHVNDGTITNSYGPKFVPVSCNSPLTRNLSICPRAVYVISSHR